MEVMIITRMMTRSFSELKKFSTFIERYNYLRLNSSVGNVTFGFDRYINQQFYRSRRWLRIRDIVIVRDNGCDLGIEGHEIGGQILVHHMNPISPEDLEKESLNILNPEFLISVSQNTHLAIHYGSEALLPELPVVRYSGDTCLW